MVTTEKERQKRLRIIVTAEGVVTDEFETHRNSPVFLQSKWSGVDEFEFWLCQLDNNGRERG